MSKKYIISTYGCQMNKSDSERMAVILEKKGYQAARKENEADLIVINMCSVRQSAVDRVHGQIRNLAKLKKKNTKLKIVLTGCILKKDRGKFKQTFDEIWDKENYFDILPKRQSASTAYIPISNGCNNFCTYCAVPLTRGGLICRGHQEILKETKEAIKNGSKEIWLLGQNVNDYNSPSDKTIDFPKLLKLVIEIPGDFKIKFISPNPKNFSDELIETMAGSEKIALYLNLPVQSGDNEILKRMRRFYTAGQYKKLVGKIRKKMPNIFLSTDIIVGFPGETRKQFENTLKLFKEIDFDMAYIAKFSTRPGTAANKMTDNVSPEEKRKRWKFLNDLILKKLKEKQKKEKKKIIVIIGPTAAGKSALAVKLAEKFNGQVISADSRQVYKGMDIGTGKITEKEMKGIPHYLLDVASPKRKFSVSQYRKLAWQAINKVFDKGKIPILCGGSGFYVQAVIDGLVIPEVKPDWQLRAKLEKLNTKQLFQKLKKLDYQRAEKIDKNNRRRLIRALEIVMKTKKPVPALKKNPSVYPVLMLGVKKEKEQLKKSIKKRLLERLKDEEMIKETEKLRRSGISWQRLEEFGLEYRFVSRYLQKKLTYSEMINLIQKESEHFAKRQMTWFRRDKRIRWIKNRADAEKSVKAFLKK
ncbi:MAG TPA: tRNA (adenosine(37)-N6)-dimethylallyltransferase MiaA [Patescibacteria group bacterium]|nr:tRNA (adenosine(37)-N6)-dimethylallyltransferase MiaA [Patescibacteria group bacterium]